MFQTCAKEPRPIWYIFPGMGTQWPGMGIAMMEIDAFRKSIMKSHDLLKPHGVNLLELISKGTKKTFEDIINSFVCVISIQVWRICI